MSRSLPVLVRVTGTHTNVGTSEETTIQLDDSSQTWLLHAFHFVVNGGSGAGSAASYQPRIGQAASFSAGDINERVAYDAQTIATDGLFINDVYATPIPIRSDANGRVYLRPGFNTGSDNDADYELYFQLVRG